MPLSRLRFRLAIRYAAAFLVCLVLLNGVLYAYLRRAANQRLNRELERAAEDVVDAVRAEYGDHPAAGARAAASEVVSEWSAHRPPIAIVLPEGPPLVRTDSADAVPALAAIARAGASGVERASRPGEHELRVAVRRATGMPAFSVGAYESTERIDEELEAFVLWLLFSAPLVLALSGVAGYLLSRPALRPIRDLETDIERIAPDELGRRLPVTDDPDEIDRVKIQINALFERLEKAQLRNRRFLQEAAHQIRTPLTIVLGETALSLDRGNGAHADGHRGTLQRVRVAAEQMRRRVDELLLLARAEAGEQPLLHDIVELDGLALESADLMRARATALGRQLELTRVDPVTVRGNEQLLREAMLELLENACRYARRNPIRISVIALDQGAAIEVVTPHAPGAAGHEGGSGLGLQIVRWIASAHGGELRVSDDGDARRDTLVLASDPVPAVNAAVDGGAAR